MTTAEGDRLAEAAAGGADWRRWGTYLSERAWGTVREDYSADGDAWRYFPFEHARSRAYRWNEDGLAGWCDRDQVICLGLALWNGRDPFLKERPFGLTNEQGNHGEDVKDYWFYTDNLPSHAYASMTYKYPQAPFPYADLVAQNAARGQEGPEYELFDALREDWLANRYFDVQVEYAKASAEDVVMRITVTNRGPDEAPIHVLPHLWYRNTWSWEAGAPAPRIRRAAAGAMATEHPAIGQRWLFVTSSVDAEPPLLFCENETNARLLFGTANESGHAKDGINDAVVAGDAAAAASDEGSKAAAHVTATLGPGGSLTVLARFAPADLRLPFADAEAVLAARTAEADEFYADLAADHLGDDERLVQRQALSGLLWCKQYYHYSVRRWLQGDPTGPPPPESRWTGRNSDWQHLANRDVILMPDAWEYPWYAAWDLAFHCVTVAMVDPDFAKEQVLLMLSSTYQHPHGQIPAYEWELGDTNPPLYAWATWQVYQLDRRASGVGDREFLAAAYRAVTLEVMWWLNQKDAQDRGVFGGGFLGMDNIGVFDRDQPLPTGGSLAQVDGTAWMAAMVMQMLEINVELAREEPHYDRMFGRWVWDSWLIANALEKGSGRVGFWNERTWFYHDVVELPDGTAQPLEVFSMQALVPLFASIAVPVTARDEVAAIRAQFRALIEAYDEPPNAVKLMLDGGDGTHVMFAIANEERLLRILGRVLDPEQFLSPFGIRSLSRGHRDQPYSYRVDDREYRVEYAPAESPTRMFGGNSNWRGPVWFPMNFLLVESINAYARFLGGTVTLADPTGSVEQVTLAGVADDLARRLASLFLRDADGRRPVLGDNEYFQSDPHWRDLVPFFEYFDGDTGRGLGASHQTGWTATVALLLQYGGALRFVDRA
ncbi:MAG: MGH1-like glycoside hydrolase domain-containing protein [Candidatus Nanopelagicales bacterium]